MFCTYLEKLNLSQALFLPPMKESVFFKHLPSLTGLEVGQSDRYVLV